jgi:Protein of unknown function (DUF2628)
MATYTVHEPPPKRDESAPDPERLVFVRDGFSFWAFLLAPLWMLWHRLWLVLIGYVLITIALQVVLPALGAAATVSFAVGTLVSLLVGFEAATLRRFGLARRRFRNVGIVVGDDLEAAERRFFDARFKDARLNARSADPGSPTATAPARALPTLRKPAPDVIGLFPEPGAPR